MDPRMRGVLVAELARSGDDEGQGLAIDRDDGLTDRELEIVRLVAAGKKNKEVAEQLAISERTVRTNLTSVFQKLGVRDRIGLVMYALRHGLTAAA
jgi:DNA-binding NarL/FixJ family response regulator